MPIVLETGDKWSGD